MNFVADAMEADATLDPDGSVRLVVWGDADAEYPGDDAPGAEVFGEVESAIECFCGYRGHGIADIPQGEAIAAARAEAARFSSYVRPRWVGVSGG
jgi:hypothetical protein